MVLTDPEILIVGGGMAGCAAALAAGEQGASVLVIERTERLGGNAANANVGTICGAYVRSNEPEPKPAGNRFCRQLVADIIRLPGSSTPIALSEGLFVIPYEWSSLSMYLETRLADSGVIILKEAEIVSVKTEDGLINSIEIKKNEYIRTLQPKAVIDCSGNAIISELAGLEMLSSSTYQAASQVFRIRNVQTENEFSLDMSLKKAMIGLTEEHSWPSSFKTLSVIPGSLKGSQVDLKLTMPAAITDDKDMNARISAEAKEYVRSIFPQLKERVSALKDSVLDIIFPELGIRIMKRSRGLHVLTEEEVLAGMKHEDGIALGTWPIEEWNTRGKLEMKYFAENEGYEIPARCLISDQVGNLFFAGKNISATDHAIGSARVIGTCIQTGYAAGKLATCGGQDERNKLIALLHKELLPS